MSENATIDKVRNLVVPIVADLHLDLYDLEYRGGVLRVTLDTPPGSEGGVDLDTIALATRLIGRDLDHHDPVPVTPPKPVQGIQQALEPVGL